MSSNPVVHNRSKVGEQEFHNALVEGLAAAARKIGRGTLADALDMTTRGLDKIFTGGSTHPKRLFDALAVDDNILDHICALYGRKLVPRDAAPEASAAPPIVAALHKVIEAEADGTKTHTELLDMEDELRCASKTIDGLLERVADIKKPRVVRA